MKTMRVLGMGVIAVLALAGCDPQAGTTNSAQALVQCDGDGIVRTASWNLDFPETPPASVVPWPDADLQDGKPLVDNGCGNQALLIDRIALFGGGVLGDVQPVVNGSIRVEVVAWPALDGGGADEVSPVWTYKGELFDDTKWVSYDGAGPKGPYLLPPGGRLLVRAVNEAGEVLEPGRLKLTMSVSDFPTE